MKFSIIILTIFLFACSDNVVINDLSEQAKFNSKLDSLEKKSLATKVLVDSLLLGYKFGMTKEEVIKHTNQLEKANRLKKNSSNQHYYELDSKYGSKYKGYVFAKYLSNKLSSMGLIFNDEPQPPIMVFKSLDEFYKSIYGQSNLIIKPVKDMDVFQKYWIVDNLKIKIESGVSNAYVEYIDLRFEEEN